MVRTKILMKRICGSSKIGSRKREIEKRKRRKAKKVREEPEIPNDPVQVEGPDEIDDDDDGAPDEMPVDKSGSDFIPLKKDTKRKRKPKAAVVEEEPEVVDEDTEEQSNEESIVKKPKRENRFVERFPGRYFGTKKTDKFRVIDLSSDTNNRSKAQRRAMDLKSGMFDRHRRVTGTQYLGQLHKTKMMGKG